MKEYDKNEELSCLKYWDVNNLYRWAKSQKLPVNGFNWVEERFIKSYNKESDKGYFLEVDVQYPKNLHNLHKNFPFFHI